ncbi:MAG: site-2 protease family protein [Sulfitobacter sp.]
MMGTGPTLFTFRGPWGVPIEVGSSLIFLVLLLVGIGGSAETLKYDLVFAALLVGSIFLHEMGHAWGCIIQGVPVRRVMLYGGGGFCEYARAPSRTQQELIVAMGPIVNLVIWAVASLSWTYFPPGLLSWSVWLLGATNLFLAVMNLLPVHPLDGGKLFELLLLRFLPAQTASRISGSVGLVISVLWIPAMIYCFVVFGFVLLFIPPILLHWQKAKGAW